jgi:chemotaxis protein MotB
LGLCCGIVFLLVGCECQSNQLKDLKAQNRIQQDRIADLESQLSLCQTDLQQKQSQLKGLTSESGANAESKDAMIAALEADIAKKKALIAQMQAQLLQSGTVLPPEMNMLLQEFAKSSDMIDFDADTGSLKFKNDLMFAPGSDQVKGDAAASLKALADIMNSAEGKQFDIVIVGHTDDVPIKRPATKAKHPTNWHLSVHRAIGVESSLSASGIAEERMAVKGYSEFRPLEPNKPNKKGNSVNRRVEIFIVPGQS